MQPKCIVMDDKTYIKADAKQILCLEFFVGNPTWMFRKKVEKFAKKYLVWQTIQRLNMKRCITSAIPENATPLT